MTYLGERCGDIYENLLTPNTEETLEHALALFDTHFKPKINIPYEIYTFQKISQNVDESINQLHIHLNQQALKSNFGKNVDTELKQYITLNPSSSKVCQYYFQSPDITLNNLLTFTETLKQTTRHTKDTEVTNQAFKQKKE